MLQPGYIHVPFIVETGGRVHDKARQWLDTIASDCEIMDAENNESIVCTEKLETLWFTNKPKYWSNTPMNFFENFRQYSSSKVYIFFLYFSFK